MSELTKLFEPLTIGRMQVKNRVMMPGMSAGQVLDADLNVTPEMIAYYVERAKARPGLMAIGASQVVPPPPGDKPKGPLSLYDDKWIPSLKRLVEAVHQYDTKFGIQLWDGGTQAGTSVSLSPSGVPANAAAVKAFKDVSIKALTSAEIRDVVRHFADAAVRCQKAGFDFVEIHAGHGYLISAFLAPYFNRRTDEYGGNHENRARFVLEILRAVREAVGPEMGVGVKINGDDFMAGEGGFTIADAVALAPMLERDGADYISVTAGVMGSTRLTVPPMYEKQGCFTHLAEEVKKVVSIPVAAIGRIKDPMMAEDLVASGKTDIVCMGRAMIVDSDVVDKARRGDFKDIRKCLADCRGCIDHEMRSIKQGNPGQVSCVLNPRVQRESVCIDIEGTAKANPKKVLVIGAGLSGLEVARRTAFSGHKVTLCESRSFIGGQIQWAKMVPGRNEIGDMLPWYEHQLEKHKVDVRLNTKVDEALIKSLAPDVVFVCTGSVPQVPQNMLASVTNAKNIDLLMIDDIMEHGLEPGKNILVVGGNQIGMQAADYLSEGGRQVCVVESHSHFAFKLAANDRWYLTSRLMEKNVRRVKNVANVEIDGNDHVWLVTDKGREHVPGVDTIVFASERRSDRSLTEVVKGMGLETYVIGDAFDVNSEDAGTIFANVAQAYDIARRI